MAHPTQQRRRTARRLVAAVLVAMLATVVAGCGAPGTASGVEQSAAGPVLRFKPCDTNQALRVVRVVDRGGRAVWTASARSGSEATNVITIAASVPGYAVTDRLGSGGLTPGTTYHVLSEATDGTAWGGPAFDPADLRAGKVLVAGQRLDAASWARDKPSCKQRSWTAVAVAAVLAGVGGAVLMALILGPLWLLRRAALRRAQAQQGHLPWLHDPPPDQGGVSFRLPRRRRPPPDN